MTIRQGICMVAQCDKCKRISKSYEVDRAKFVNHMKICGWTKPSAGAGGVVLCPQCSGKTVISDKEQLAMNYGMCCEDINFAFENMMNFRDHLMYSIYMTDRPIDPPISISDMQRRNEILNECNEVKDKLLNLSTETMLEWNKIRSELKGERDV